MDPLGKQAGKLSGTILDGGRSKVQLWRLSAPIPRKEPLTEGYCSTKSIATKTSRSSSLRVLQSNVVCGHASDEMSRWTIIDALCRAIM